jgi:hypothetical protein
MELLVKIWGWLFIGAIVVLLLGMLVIMLLTFFYIKNDIDEWEE